MTDRGQVAAEPATGAATDSTKRLVVTDLTVCRSGNGGPVVKDVSFSLEAGKLLGLVGESGAGKSTAGLAVLGYVSRGLEIAGGRVEFEGQDILRVPEEKLRALRGGQIAYVPQDPASALNPMLRIGTQLSEVLSSHADRLEDPDARLTEVLAEVGLDGTPELLRRFPHQLSGGQQQRVAVAMAFACRPAIVVADEPTTGLDVSTQRKVIETLRTLCATYGVAGIYISHDLAVVSQLVTHVAVMYKGRLVESAPTEQLFAAPTHEYTKSLLRAARLPGAATVSQTGAAVPNVVEVRDLHASYQEREILHGVDVDVPREGLLAVVGESGAGKTTFARCLVGLHSQWTGAVTFDGAPVDPHLRLRPETMLQDIRYVFQNPYGSLNPRRTIEQILARPLERHGGHSKQDVRTKVEHALDDVALTRRYLGRYPDQLSGGERQRVAIARALVVDPTLLVCDEVTSALDVSVQAVIVDLLLRLQRERRLSLVFVTHNIELVRSMARTVVVLLEGSVVEAGSTEEVLGNPTDSYTRRLVADVPTLR